MSNLMLRTQIEFQSFSRALTVAVAGAGRRMRHEEGQDLVEYGGLLILVAAIVGALFAIGIVSDFTTYVGTAVSHIFSASPS